MKAIARRIRISSKKANLVAALVRNKDVTEAIEMLKFTPKKAAGIIKKVIESAVANAETNFKQEKKNLYIKEIVVTEGPTQKRSIPISKGRTHPLLKRTAHITVKVEAKKEEVKKEKSKKAAPKEEKTIEKDATTDIKGKTEKLSKK